ncbi:MAG: hypothetical protein R3F05_10950 [Planctomycetota bacterium]
MIAVHLDSVLLYADGVQLAVFRDRVASPYLAVLAERTKDGDTYLCTRVSPGRLAGIRGGRLDLREAFESPELSEMYSATVVDAERNHLELAHLDAVPAKWLPDHGFRLDLSARAGAAGADVTLAAQDRNRAVVYLHLNPPEAFEEPKIDALRLSRALSAFQKLVDRAYRRVLSSEQRAQRRADLAVDESTLQVLSFAEGSFGVHLQAKAAAGLFGETPVSRALERVDSIVSEMADPDASVAIARANRGHFVSAYQELLKFVFEGETPLSYRWSAPISDSGQQYSILPSQARDVYAALVAREDLSRRTRVRRDVHQGGCGQRGLEASGSGRPGPQREHRGGQLSPSVAL